MLYGNIAIFDQISFPTDTVLEGASSSARPPTRNPATPLSTRWPRGEAPAPPTADPAAAFSPNGEAMSGAETPLEVASWQETCTAFSLN